MSLLMMTQYFDALRDIRPGQQHHPDAAFTFGRAGSLHPAAQLDNHRSACCRKIAGTGAGQQKVARLLALGLLLFFVQFFLKHIFD
jgi:hypothetical protein